MVLSFFKQSDKERYAEMLKFEHRWFDIKGLTTQAEYTLELEKVYVQLRIAAGQYQSAGHDPFNINSRDGTDIWEWMREHKQALVILGPPGSGKTTLLRSIVLKLLHKDAHRETHLPKNTIPIFLHLRDLSAPIANDPERSLASLVNDHLEQIRLRLEKGSNSIQESPDLSWIEKQLKKKRCMIVLDGLDEVADAVHRWQVVKWVQKQFELLEGNRFVVTSRPGGYIANPLENVTSLEVQSFDHEQQEKFITNWYLEQEISSKGRDDDGVKGDAIAGATDLLDRIRRNPDLVSLAINPLTLTMIANVHRFRNQLPGKRVELYAEICDVFLGQWRSKKGIKSDRLDSAQKIHVLQPLAFYMMLNQTREIELEEVRQVIGNVLMEVDRTLDPVNFIQIIQDSSGLLIEKEWHIYSFSHKTFQEYLAARYIKSNPERLPVLTANVSDDWWHETIRLYAAQNDATAIIKACIDEIDTGDIEKSTAPLELGILCLEERLKVDPGVELEFRQKVQEGVDVGYNSRTHYFRKGLLNMRLNSMIPISNEVYRDQTLLTQAEYQYFVDEQLHLEMEHQPDHWEYAHFASNHGNQPISGVRAFDAQAFVEWLTTFHGSAWTYRLPTLEELDPNQHFDNPIWVIDENNQVVSTHRASQNADYRAAFARAFEKIKLATKDEKHGDYIYSIAFFANDLIHSLDTEAHRDIEGTNIDDRFLDLAIMLAQPTTARLREINEIIEDYEVPRRFWSDGTVPQPSPKDTQEAEDIANVKRTIRVLKDEKRKQSKTHDSRKTTSVDSLYDIENLSSVSEQFAIKVSVGLEIRNAFSKEDQDLRRNVTKNVMGLSILLRHARRQMYNLASEEKGQDILKILKKVRKFEEIDRANSGLLSADKSFEMAMIISQRCLSDDRNEQIMGFFHEMSLRNAALWQLIALIGLRKDRPHPRRVLLQRFIRLLSLVLIIDIERAIAEAGTRGMIWRIRNSSSPLKEFGGEAMNDLRGVCKALDQIEIYRKIERPLESILLVKNLKTQVRL